MSEEFKGMFQVNRTAFLVAVEKYHRIQKEWDVVTAKLKSRVRSQFENGGNEQYLDSLRWGWRIWNEVPSMKNITFINYIEHDRIGNWFAESTETYLIRRAIEDGIFDERFVEDYLILDRLGTTQLKFEESFGSLCQGVKVPDSDSPVWDMESYVVTDDGIYMNPQQYRGFQFYTSDGVQDYVRWLDGGNSPLMKNFQWDFTASVEQGRKKRLR